MGDRGSQSITPRRRSSSRLAGRASPFIFRTPAQPGRRNAERPIVLESSCEEDPSEYLEEDPSEHLPSREEDETEGEAEGSNAAASLTAYPQHILFRDDAHRVTYQLLKARGIVPSRCLDEAVLEEIGILRDVTGMLENVGLLDFVSEQRYTYLEPTLEFFSSLGAQEGNLEGTTEGRISFRLANRDFVLTEEVLNEILKFPRARPFPAPTLSDIQAFWGRISPEAFSRPLRASCIPNPAVRYVHRLLSQNVFARVENVGNVTVPELHLLRGMLLKEKVNVGYYFIKNLRLTLQHQHRELAMGGAVTAVASALGIDLSGIEPVPGSVALDLGGLRYMGLISREGPPHRLLRRDLSQMMTLPNPERTSIYDPRNWLLLPPTPRPDRCQEGGPSRDPDASHFSDHPEGSVEERLRKAEQELKELREAHEQLRRIQQEDHAWIFDLKASMEFRFSEAGRLFPDV